MSLSNNQQKSSWDLVLYNLFVETGLHGAKCSQMLKKATFTATINAGFTQQDKVFAPERPVCQSKITQTLLSERIKYYNKVKIAYTQQLGSITRKDTWNTLTKICAAAIMQGYIFVNKSI